MPTSIEKIFEDVQLHVNFTQASSRSNIVTYDSTASEPENISTAFGKLSKWYEALVPTGGSSGKILAWNSSGTAKWSDPLHPTITKSADTTSTASPAHGGTFTTVDSVTRDANGHVTKINTKTVTLPNDQNTDTLMTQTNTTTSADYRVLLSGNANDTTETTTGRKSTNLKFNPNTGVLSVSSGVTTKTITRSALKGMLTGSGTAAQDKGSGVSPRYFPAKWTFNTGLTAANGDVFIIKLPTAGHSNGVFLSIDNGANYYPISVNGTSRLTTHYGNGYSIAVMFKSDGSTADMFPLAGGDSRSTVTGGCWQVLNYYDSGNSNTYDRNRYNANIKAGSSALVGGNIIVGKDGVFNHLKSGGAFDISYPILYLNAAVAANATTTDTYDILHITITTTQSITLTAYKPVFIKGTLSGTIFTPVSATPLTQTVPTTDDGYVYIYLGNATSTTSFYMQERHPIYEYKNGVFGEITNYSANAGSVAWSGVSGKPTTISGYGIADAKIENGTITLGSNTITPLTSHQTITTGSTNGTISVAGTDVAVKGLGTAAYKAESDFAVSRALANNANLNSITTPGFYNCGGSNSVSNKPSGVDAFGLEVIHDASGSWYTQILYANADNPKSYRRNYNSSTWSAWTEDKLTDSDTKNTAGSTDTSSKIFLIGATSQAANPQTYSDNEVYTTSGVLTTKSVQVGGGSCTMQYNSTTQSLDFVFV